MTLYQVTCDQFDNSRTGFYATEAEAIDAFWAENHFSEGEQKQARPYTREVKEVTADVIAEAAQLSDDGSPSPALADELAKIVRRLRDVEPWAPNYFGNVPSDWEEVAENLESPTVARVAEILAEEPEVDGLDGAISAAYAEMMPRGYEGVAVDIRERG